MEKDTAVQGTLRKPTFAKEDATALKGAAILMMMLHHCFRETSLYEGFTISFAPFPEQTVVRIALFFKICVSLFAFVSGYGLFLSYQNKRTSATRWAARRYVSTFSGFWAVWILTAIVTQLINHRTQTILFKEGVWKGLAYVMIDFSGLAQMFRTPTLNGTWWYMSAAAAFIVLIPFVWRFRKELVLVLIGSIFLLRVLTGSNGSGIYTGGNSVYVFLSPFLLGSIFANGNLVERWFSVFGDKWWKKGIKFTVETAALYLLYRLYHNLPIDSFWEFHFGFVALVMILFLAEFVLPIPGVKQALRFLGKHSYNIFLVHTLIRAYYLHDFTYSLRHFMLIALFLLASSLLISVAIELLKKVTRYQKLINRLCDRITGTAAPAIENKP